MDYAITPEPTPEERAALIVALERLLARDGGALGAPPAYTSAWRQAGVRENVELATESDGP